MRNPKLYYHFARVYLLSADFRAPVFSFFRLYFLLTLLLCSAFQTLTSLLCFSSLHTIVGSWTSKLLASMNNMFTFPGNRHPPAAHKLVPRSSNCFSTKDILPSSCTNVPRNGKSRSTRNIGNVHLFAICTGSSTWCTTLTTFHILWGYCPSATHSDTITHFHDSMIHATCLCLMFHTCNTKTVSVS